MDITLHAYKCELKTSFTYYRTPVNEVHGLILKIQNGDHVGLGDIPLPPDPTTHDQIHKNLDKLTHNPSPSLLPPPIAWAYDCAIRNLKATASTHRLTPTHPPTQGLLTSSLDEKKTQLLAKANSGMTIFKFKISHLTDNELLHHLSTLTPLLPKNGAFRLDANQSWTLEKALLITKKISQFPIDYIEDPLQNTSELPEFCKKSHIPIALDEPLLTATRLAPFEGLKALVIKPSRYSRGRLHTLITWAKHYNLTITFSSNLESPIGLQNIADFAATMAPHNAHGLDTLYLFKSLSNLPVSLKI